MKCHSNLHNDSDESDSDESCNATDRPPSKAFFDFNRYEYRLQLCTNCCHMRYRGLRMPESSCNLRSLHDGYFRRDEELELCAIHTGGDYIVGQTVGHHDPSGRPAWVVIWRCVTWNGLLGKSSARVFPRLRRPYLIRELCALCRSLSMQSRALSVILFLCLLNRTCYERSGLSWNVLCASVSTRTSS